MKGTIIPYSENNDKKKDGEDLTKEVIALKNLELDPHQSFTPQEIKAAFKKLAVKHHPDKGGDPEKFKAVNESYNILLPPKIEDPSDSNMYKEHQSVTQAKKIVKAAENLTENYSNNYGLYKQSIKVLCNKLETSDKKLFLGQPVDLETHQLIVNYFQLIERRNFETKDNDDTNLILAVTDIAHTLSKAVFFYSDNKSKLEESIHSLEQVIKQTETILGLLDNIKVKPNINDVSRTGLVLATELAKQANTIILKQVDNVIEDKSVPTPLSSKKLITEMKELANYLQDINFSTSKEKLQSIIKQHTQTASSTFSLNTAIYWRNFLTSVASFFGKHLDPSSKNMNEALVLKNKFVSSINIFSNKDKDQAKEKDPVHVEKKHTNR